MTGVQWKHSVSMWICWMRCQPLGQVLGFAKAWLRLRQRTQTEECCRYSPLCGERQRNAGCQATYTDTNEHSQRPWAMRQGRGYRPHSQTPLTTSICDIITIYTGPSWFNPPWLSKHWASYWRVSDWLSNKLLWITYRTTCHIIISSAEWIFFCFTVDPSVNLHSY